MNYVRQGDILSVENIPRRVLVVSKDFFNKTEMAFVCPIEEVAKSDALHIKIHAGDIEGYVICESLKMLDLRIRGYKCTERLSVAEIMNITDAIQSIFDYV